MNTAPDFQKFVVHHTRFHHALNTLERKYQFHRPTDASTGITVTGPTGAGKTSLLEQFMRKHAHEEKLTPDGWIKPIISITVPAYPSMKDFLITLFHAIGADPGSRVETIACKSQRLTTLIKHCGVKVIILEEFQHFLKASDSKILLTASLLKNLMNNTNIMLILSGIDVTNLLSFEQQLGRRNSARLELERFNWYNDHDQEEFSKIVMAFVEKIQQHGWSLPEITDPELISMFYRATEGNICYIKAIWSEAVDTCRWEKRTNITMFDLQNAWYNTIKSVFPDNENPFESTQLSTIAPPQTAPKTRKQKEARI